MFLEVTETYQIVINKYRIKTLASAMVTNCCDGDLDGALATWHTGRGTSLWGQTPELTSEDE